VPLRETICGLSAALSVTLSVVVRVPDAVGLNVTLMLQLAPSESMVPQVWVCAKSPAFFPPMLILVMFNVAVPLFFSVKVWALLRMPIGWVEKVRLVL
jgi:hypothetical protein